MSMNLSIKASRLVKVISTGDVETQSAYLRVWQTPTSVTYEIVDSSDPLDAYKKWVLSISKDEEVEVYADDDIFQEKPPIGKTLYNAGEDHIALIEADIRSLIEEGYSISYEVG